MTTTNKQHVHHDMIVAWAKDPSRKLQFKVGKADNWVDMSVQPGWNPDMFYRFKPEPVVIKYREYVYIVSGTYRIGIVNVDVDKKYIENMNSFVEWRGCWKIYTFEPCPHGS